MHKDSATISVVSQPSAYRVSNLKAGFLAKGKSKKHPNHPDKKIFKHNPRPKLLVGTQILENPSGTSREKRLLNFLAKEQLDLKHCTTSKSFVKRNMILMIMKIKY